ncbi:MAG: ABC transporter permease, partial [Chloroflexi bacterium]|nr:ABC transporter permease [Chloroflexota bacterium]
YCFAGLGVWFAFRVLAFPDLTPEGSFPTGAAVCAVLIMAGVNPFVATLVAIFAGAVAGVLTGLLNTKLNINPLLAGILITTALYSVNLTVMGRSNIALLNVDTIYEISGRALHLDKNVNSIALTAAFALACAALLTWFLHTQLGLAVRATGDNEHMIRGLGVDTDAIKLLGLAIGNGLVALSGAVVAQAQGFADVGMGVGSLVTALAAVILAEAILRARGIGPAVAAVVFGSFVYRLIIGLALRAGLGPTNLKLGTAALVIAALGLPLLRTRFGGAVSKIFNAKVGNAERRIAEQDVLP